MLGGRPALVGGQAGEPGSRSLTPSRQPAWKRPGPQNNPAPPPPPPPQGSAPGQLVCPSGREGGRGDKDQRSRVPCGGRSPGRRVGVGRTSHVHPGLQFPRWPAGVGVGGSGVEMVTWSGRGRAGRGGGALGALKERAPGGSGGSAAPGAGPADGGPRGRQPLGDPTCAARSGWCWPRRSCTVKPRGTSRCAPPPRTPPAPPGRLSAPRAPASFGGPYGHGGAGSAGREAGVAGTGGV